MIEAFFTEFEESSPESVSLRTLSRNEILIATGHRETHSYLVLSGALRVVYQSESQSQVMRFGYRGSFLTSLPAFFDQSPSLFDIIAIRKTQIKCFEKQALFRFAESSSYYQKVYLNILQDLIKQQVEREIDILTPLPHDRYIRVLERSPELFKEVPAVHIANYLRMTPEHLSRIRKS